MALQSEGVLDAIAAMPQGRWLLAVSGGRDSMALLAAFGEVRAHEIAAVATFDHGSGAAARRASALVERTAIGAGLSIVVGSTPPAPERNEATWREARWRFLAPWAEELGATVVTAHTRDDQVETIVQRILRGAGARGLAGMSAAGVGPFGSRVARPLMEVSRAALAAFASEREVTWVDDPSNLSLAFERNRVRLEILPALERARPGFSDWCLDLAARAAAWRVEVEDAVTDWGLLRTGVGSASIPAASLASLGDAEWRTLWPAVAARAGVILDRRGVERAAEWAPSARVGATIPLAGGACIERTASTFVVRRTEGQATPGNDKEEATVLY